MNDKTLQIATMLLASRLAGNTTTGIKRDALVDDCIYTARYLQKRVREIEGPTQKDDPLDGL
jgi:hypothetical protein